MPAPTPQPDSTLPLKEEIEAWSQGDDTTLGSLIHLFDRRAFAVVLMLLMAPSALPIPTGGVTHILDVIAAFLCLQLIAGRRDLWLPARWQAHAIDTEGRLIGGLRRVMRITERVAQPRMSYLFGHRAGNMAYGALALCGVLGALIAPPFSGLDTLPALAVIILSLGVLCRDALIAAVGILVLIAGWTLVFVLGRAALSVATAMWPW